MSGCRNSAENSHYFKCSKAVGIKRHFLFDSKLLITRQLMAFLKAQGLDKIFHGNLGS